MYKLHLVGLFLLITLVGCKSKQHIPDPLTEDNFPFEILDSVQASKAIVVDKKDGFFENITPLDMSIQMKFSLNGNESRDALLESYRSFLQTEVMDFSEEEKVFLKKVMIRAMNLCNGMSANLVPGPVRLIKTRGNHYGDGAFYTREKCIVIPESAQALEHGLHVRVASPVFELIGPFLNRIPIGIGNDIDSLVQPGLLIKANQMDPIAFL